MGGNGNGTVLKSCRDSRIIRHILVFILVYYKGILIPDCPFILVNSGREREKRRRKDCKGTVSARASP